MVCKATIANPTTIRATIASTLIIENQVSNSPNKPTLIIFTNINKSKITNGPTHWGRPGNQYCK